MGKGSSGTGKFLDSQRIELPFALFVLHAGVAQYKQSKSIIP